MHLVDRRETSSGIGPLTSDPGPSSIILERDATRYNNSKKLSKGMKMMDGGKFTIPSH